MAESIALIVKENLKDIKDMHNNAKPREKLVQISLMGITTSVISFFFNLVIFIIALVGIFKFDCSFGDFDGSTDMCLIFYMIVITRVTSCVTLVLVIIVNRFAVKESKLTEMCNMNTDKNEEIPLKINVSELDKKINSYIFRRKLISFLAGLVNVLYVTLDVVLWFMLIFAYCKRDDNDVCDGVPTDIESYGHSLVYILFFSQLPRVLDIILPCMLCCRY